MFSFHKTFLPYKPTRIEITNFTESVKSILAEFKADSTLQNKFVDEYEKMINAYANDQYHPLTPPQHPFSAIQFKQILKRIDDLPLLRKMNLTLLTAQSNDLAKKIIRLGA